VLVNPSFDVSFDDQYQLL